MEGEIDTKTALSMQLQGITGTTGANSIPKDSKGFYDVNWLDKFDEIIICYDNDKAGRKGSKKLADEARQQKELQRQLAKAQKEIDKMNKSKKEDKTMTGKPMTKVAVGSEKDD